MDRHELARDLEQLMDAASLDTLVELLAEIAAEKAEHIRSNWQDPMTAKVWDAAARQLGRVKPTGI
jgi:hypothetical protein